MISEFVLSKKDQKIFLQTENPVCIIKKIILNIFNGFEVAYKPQQFIGSSTLEKIKRIDPNLLDNQCFFVENQEKESMSLMRPSLILEAAEEIFSKDRFIVYGDVYLKTSINKLSYPISNEMIVYSKSKNKGFPGVDARNASGAIISRIRDTVPFAYRIVDLNDSSPTLNNRFIIEAHLVNPITKMFSWIPIIEGGSIGNKITNYIDSPGEKAWMLNINLDLFAMAAFSIPDRRILWSKSAAIHKKFYAESYESSFKKKSAISINKYPEYTSNVLHLRDFYIENDKPVSHSDVYSLIRDVAGDYVEQADHMSSFSNVMTTKNYQHYRLHMRNVSSPNIDNEGIMQILSALRANAKNKMGLVLK